MEVRGPSGAPNYSQEMRELSYMHTSHSNISNFVSVTLSGKINYGHWKTQMLCFIRSQGLEDILQQSSPNDPFNELVKGWIFGSVDEEILVQVLRLDASAIWKKLGQLYGQNFMLLPDDVYEEMEEYRYVHASNLNLINFVSVKLAGKRNYSIWKKQMLCLVRSQDLEYILHQESPNDGFNGLVMNWILGSLNQNEFLKLRKYENPSHIWRRLEDDYDYESRYTQALNVNVSNFVSVKLSSKRNYPIWKTQMLCLLGSLGLEYILEDRDAEYAEIYKANHFDKLVKSWIFSSVSEDILLLVINCEYASNVWKILNATYGHNDEDASEVDGRNYEDVNSDIRDETRDEVERNDRDNLRKDLKNAVVEGCWWKAKAILKNNKDAVREQITGNGDTILHLAVALGQNKFLDQLLNFTDEDFVKTKTSKGKTALHVAVIFDNYYAFQLLLKKNKNLLEIVDDDHYSSVPFSFSRYLNLDMILFLCRNYADEIKKEEYSEGVHKYVVRCLEKAIFTKRYDVAQELVKAYPESVRMDDQVMMTMATTFPSELGIGEAFLYPSLKNMDRIIVERSKLLFDPFGFLYTMAEDVLWKMSSAFKNNIHIRWLPEIVLILLVPLALLYAIYQFICLLVLLLSFPFSVLYFLLWKGLAIVAEPIKNIEMKKKEYEEAKKLLNTIFEHIKKSGTYSTDGHPDYSRPFLEAARQGAFEVVDEILFLTPGLIKYAAKEKDNIILSAIINRSEKVYNLIYHMRFPMSSYRDFKDSSENNLLHLTGRLAPSHVLSCTTGAALQLQRELQWYEEVKKLMLPRDLMKENINEETPNMVFAREHADFLKEGEQWMKTTAESCSITAALIVTIVFAAAITVPGGSNQETGIPLFKKEIAFDIFAVSNAISLFASATSLLVFLSILTTRFSEEDFLVSLPRRLIIGLCALFLSTTFMIVAFGAILFLVFCDQRPWMLGPISVLACFPIATIVTLQFPLLFDLFRSTYIPIFGKQSYIERGKFIPTNSTIEYTQLQRIRSVREFRYLDDENDEVHRVLDAGGIDVGGFNPVQDTI